MRYKDMFQHTWSISSLKGRVMPGIVGHRLESNQTSATLKLKLPSSHPQLHEDKSRHTQYMPGICMEYANVSIRHRMYGRRPERVLNVC
jgi:hypothetical protein